jgi:hypothetical protein
MNTAFANPLLYEETDFPAVRMRSPETSILLAELSRVREIERNRPHRRLFGQLIDFLRATPTLLN